MANDAPNRIADGLLADDSNTRRFHLGDMPQAGIPADLSEEEEAALTLHRAAIRVPLARPRFGYDEAGTPIEVPAAGLVIADPATGELKPLTVDEAGVPIPPTKAEQKATQKAARAEAKAEQDRSALDQGQR